MTLSRAPNLLVTAFGPFPGMQDNPTAALLRRLAEHVPRGSACLTVRRAGRPHVTLHEFATEWSVCGSLPATTVAFDAVVMFGVAGHRRRISYERAARNVAAGGPDVAGRLPDGAPRRSRQTRFDVARLAAAARAAGFPVAVSSSAGTYICNASYGAALGGNPWTLFVHLPPPVARGPLSAAGLERHARWLIGHVAAELSGRPAC